MLQMWRQGGLLLKGVSVMQLQHIVQAGPPGWGSAGVDMTHKHCPKLLQAGTRLGRPSRLSLDMQQPPGSNMCHQGVGASTQHSSHHFDQQQPAVVLVSCWHTRTNRVAHPWTPFPPSHPVHVL